VKAFFSQRQQFNCEQPGQATTLSPLKVPKQRTHFCFLTMPPLLTAAIVPSAPPSTPSPAMAFALVLAALDLDFFPIVLLRKNGFGTGTQKPHPVKNHQIK
jgi:hypothetical protein